MGFAFLGEDAWITSHFKRDFVGYAVEVGASDGMQGSNTLALEHAGWKVLAVEANRRFEPGLIAWRSLYRMCACGKEDLDAVDFYVHLTDMGGYSTLDRNFTHPVWHPGPDADWEKVSVPLRKLDTLLEEVGFPRLDALSIDVEGTELDVLKGLTFSRWHPKVIVCENWLEQGPVVPYLADRGYQRVERRNVNDLFVRKAAD
jgi:FkbM family methyltransferase